MGGGGVKLPPKVLIFHPRISHLTISVWGSNVKSSILEEQTLRFVFVPSINEERILRFVFIPSIVEERILRFVFVPSIVEEQLLWFVFVPSIA